MTTRSLSEVPGSSRVVAPTDRMQLSKVTSVVPFGPSTLIDFASLKVPHPSISVTLFFFIRKCTPLAIRSATVRLRL